MTPDELEDHLVQKSKSEQGFKQPEQWKVCLHDKCPECHGTGRKANNAVCVHYISCKCPKCNPYYL